jgi:hypothetical protein
MKDNERRKKGDVPGNTDRVISFNVEAAKCALPLFFSLSSSTPPDDEYDAIKEDLENPSRRQTSIHM